MTEGTWKIRPERYRARKDEPHEVNKYLDISGRMTLGEVVQAIEADSDMYIDLANITVSGCVVWTEPATREDLANWAKADKALADRVEAGERRAYERLKAKFEGDQS